MATEVIRSTLNFMTLVAFWPKPHQELKAPNGYYIKLSIMYVITLINVIGASLHFIFVSIPKDLITITAQTGVYYYTIAYQSRQKEAAHLYQRLLSFEEFGKPPQYDQHALKLSYLEIVYRSILNSVVVAYFFEPILTRKICERQNKASGFIDLCGVVSQIWMPFNIENFPIKHIFYMWQTFSVFWTYKTSASLSFLIVGTIENVLVRIWHLRVMLQEAINCKSEHEAKKLLSRCIEYHNHIFDLCTQVDIVYKRALFAHAGFSGILFGIMGFSILTVRLSLKTVSLFGAWVGAAIFASVSAQRLYNGTESIGTEVYFSRWYEKDYRFQKNLILILQRAQKISTIHAGPFAEISNIFKTAFSYLTLLKATSQ